MGIREFVHNHPLALRWHYSQLKYNFIEERFGWASRLPLKNKDFTILSNSCTAGFIYHKFHIEYTSPTTWCYIFPEEFLRLIENYRWYLKQPLEFREVSNHTCTLKDKQECGLSKFHSYPIGVLGGDVEIHFLHYKSEEEALDKWNRRLERVNYNNLFFVLSENNEFKEEYFQRFDKLPFKHKLFLTSKPRSDCKYAIWMRNYSFDMFPYIFQNYADTRKWLNGKEDTQKKRYSP